MLALRARLSAGACGAASAQDIAIGVAGPMTGGEATFGRQMKNGAEHGGRRHQRRRRRAWQEAQARCRRRCLRSQAGALGRREIRRHEAAVRGRAFLLVVVDPGFGGLCRGRRAADHAGLDQPAFTERNLWNTFRVCGRDDQQGEVAGDYLAKNYKGKNVAIIHDKTTYGKGLADETKKAINKAGAARRSSTRAYNKGDKDFTALVSKLKRRRHRRRLCRRLPPGSRPDPAADARAGHEDAC